MGSQSQTQLSTHTHSNYRQSWASLVAQSVKILPVVQKTRVRSLGWEDPLEKEMVTHSSTLAWKIPWVEEPGRLQSMWSQRVGHNLATTPPPPQVTANLESLSHSQLHPSKNTCLILTQSLT